MKYEVGDDIIVMHSNDDGKVIEILSDKMVLIEVKGVKFPAYMPTKLIFLILSDLPRN